MHGFDDMLAIVDIEPFIDWSMFIDFISIFIAFLNIKKINFQYFFPPHDLLENFVFLFTRKSKSIHSGICLISWKKSITDQQAAIDILHISVVHIIIMIYRVNDRQYLNWSDKHETSKGRQK